MLTIGAALVMEGINAAGCGRIVGATNAGAMSAGAMGVVDTALVVPTLVRPALVGFAVIHAGSVNPRPRPAIWCNLLPVLSTNDDDLMELKW
jgi:hypothetical protein